MSKRKASTEINTDSKRPKLSEKSKGPQNKQSEISDRVAVVTPNIRPGTSSSDFKPNTSNQSTSTSNTNTLPQRRRLKTQSFDNEFCACYTPFRCQLPECGYTNVSLSELCKMLEKDSE